MTRTRMPITKEGYQVLTAELKRLKTVEKPDVIKELAAAREHGDLSENAEYDAAKERQELLHKRIASLEDKLAGAEIIDTSRLPTHRVIFGVVVDVYNLSKDREESYQIVGELEADPSKGRISVMSPLGRALIGKEPGEEVTVKSPGGEIRFEVSGIRCPEAAV